MEMNKKIPGMVSIAVCDFTPEMETPALRLEHLCCSLASARSALYDWYSHGTVVDPCRDDVRKLLGHLSAVLAICHKKCRDLDQQEFEF